MSGDVELRPSKLCRRGRILLAIGVLWVAQGIGVYEQPLPLNRPPALHEYLPPIVRELSWVITGFVAMVSAFFRKPGQDRFGFFALTVMPLERAISWTITFGAGVFPSLPPVATPPLITSFNQAVVWTAVSYLIFVVAGWREMTVIRAPLEDDR